MSMFENWVSWLPELMEGLGISLQLAGASLIIGLPLGLVFATLTNARIKPLSWIVITIVELGRGIPTLILLYLVYYGLPSQGFALGSFVSAIFALSYMTAAYSSEIFRASLQAVPRGLVEAGQALGMNWRGVLGFVLLPETIRLATPAMVGFAIQVFQTTSLAFLITLPELMSRATSIGSLTFEYLNVYLLAGLLYLAITLPTGAAASFLEKRMSRHL